MDIFKLWLKQLEDIANINSTLLNNISSIIQWIQSFYILNYTTGFHFMPVSYALLREAHIF